MWVKLTAEYINLDHVYRVHINKGFKNGREECVAELEVIDPKGQIGTITRYRGADAELLQAVLAQRCRDSVKAVGVSDDAPAHALTGTIADLKLP